MKRFFCLISALAIVICGMGFAKPANQDGQAMSETVYAASEYGSNISARGGNKIETISERIDYAYKVVDEYCSPNNVPGYLSDYTCGVTAGGVAIGYYDKMYDELIPNHTGRIFMGQYLWATQGKEMQSVYDSLYTAMNSTSEGVTINGYLNGMKSYVSSRGRTASFTSAMSGASQMNFQQYKTALQSGKLLTVFLEGFSVLDFDLFRTYTNYDTIVIDISRGAHIMLAYGYLDVSYYNANNQCFRRDSYLRVSTGFSIPTLALVKLNQYCVIDDGYVTEIY